MSSSQPTLDRLDRLEVRLYRVTTESHLAIGSGEATAELRPVDKPIIRALIYEDERVPYLPASSLHGVWRAWVEKALRSKEESPGREACLQHLQELKEQKNGYYSQLVTQVLVDLGLDNEPPPDHSKLPEEWQVYRTVCNPFWVHDRCEAQAKELRKSSFLDVKRAWLDLAKLDRPCRVCSLFGHSGQRGRVRFTHAFPAMDDPSALPVDIITRVAINRQTGTADHGKLFDLEAVPPGVSFFFFILLENVISKEALNDFEYGARALKLNLATLGAHGTVGFGSVRLVQEACWQLSKDIIDFDVSLEEHDPDKLSTNGKYNYPPGFTPKYYPHFFRLLALNDREGKKHKLLKEYELEH